MGKHKGVHCCLLLPSSPRDTDCSECYFYYCVLTCVHLHTLSRSLVYFVYLNCLLGTHLKHYYLPTMKTL